MRPALSFGFALLALGGCHSSTPLSINITPGQETHTFTEGPPVTRIDVAVTSLDGTLNLTASTTPGGTFDLGDVTQDQQVGIEVTGVDATGATVMRGRSLYGLPLSGVQGDIPVFVQRTGRWARPSEGLPQTHVGGVGAALGDLYVLVAGGAKADGDPATADPKQADAFDLLSLAGASAAGFPRVPTSLVSIGEQLLLLDAAGATWVDPGAGTTADVTLPTGLASFGDVAGGAVVATGSGRMYVVGGTRRGDATKAVLAVDTDGTLTAFATKNARRGAAAVWIDTVGLVIAGGSTDDPGVEVLADGATAFAGRYPADPVEGAGAVTDGGKGVVLVGGTAGGAAAPTRRIDPACVGIMTCKASEVSMPLPAALGNVVAYALSGTQVLVIGDETDGMKLTRTFQVDLAGGVTELPLREPRSGAVPVPTQLGTLALLGGQHPDGTAATSVEMFFPP